MKKLCILNHFIFTQKNKLNEFEVIYENNLLILILFFSPISP